jgi:hypothetical protein
VTAEFAVDLGSGLRLGKQTAICLNLKEMKETCGSLSGESAFEGFMGMP